ncbi:hypothetical protein ANN_03389 [Periplaneta americana]|uniref:Tc1-like transposase DDE domain-containing protein n=1 Tax=Periplaneta americana TaxID=6978 RepID=A0ABQ8U0M4_PERAM|nr:hypothetical protein ANN_03389 [Periplaneta americana]
MEQKHGHYDEEKILEAFEMWIWRRIDHLKWTDRIGNEAVSERNSEEEEDAEANLLSRRHAYGPQLEPRTGKRLLVSRDSTRVGLQNSRPLSSSPMRAALIWGLLMDEKECGEGLEKAGISNVACIDLVFVDRGTISAQSYIEEILENHMMPFAPFIGQNVTLMHDNVRPHTARCVVQYLEEVGIRTLDLATRSPDINPIEHMWHMLGRNVQRRDVNTLVQLRPTLLEEWDLIPQEDLQRLVGSSYASMLTGCHRLQEWKYPFL